MWCGASTSTWIHETVRHTWRFDFDSSNSVSVVFVIFCLKYVEQKESLFGLVFCLFVPANLAQHFSGALCCFLFSVLFLFSFPWCRLFHLASDLAHFRVQFRSRFTVHHPSPHRHTHIHTFPQSDTLPSHSKQINSSLSTLGTPEWNAAAHSSPANTHTVVSCPLGLKEARFFVCVCVCVLAPTCMRGMGLGLDDAGFRLAAASKVSIQALSPFVYLTRFCTLCSLFPPLCLIN